MYISYHFLLLVFIFRFTEDAFIVWPVALPFPDSIPCYPCVILVFVLVLFCCVVFRCELYFIEVSTRLRSLLLAISTVGCRLTIFSAIMSTVYLSPPLSAVYVFPMISLYNLLRATFLSRFSMAIQFANEGIATIVRIEVYHWTIESFQRWYDTLKRIISLMIRFFFKLFDSIQY